MENKMLKTIKEEFAEAHKEIDSDEIRLEHFRKYQSKSFYDMYIVLLLEDIEENLLHKLKGL